MLAENLYDAMRSVNFEKHVAIVYEYLLLHDYATLGKLAAETGLAKQKVHDGSEQLINLGVLAFDMVKGKPVLYALDPDVVWPAFSRELSWRFTNTLGDYKHLEKTPNLPPPDYHDLLIHVQKESATLREAAMALYKSTAAVATHNWRDAVNSEHMSILLSETLQQANSEIRAVSSSPRLPLKAFIWQSIVNRIEQGVKYTRVADLTEIMEHGLHIAQRDIEKIGIDLRVLNTAQVQHKFYAIDKKYVVVFHNVGIGGTQQVGRVTRKRQIVIRYRKRFDTYYEMSIPASFVIKILRDSANKLLEKANQTGFDDAEISWLECLINWGTFCKLEDPNVKDQAVLEKKAIKQGLIFYGTTNRPIPNYDITMNDVSLAWSKTQSPGNK